MNSQVEISTRNFDNILVPRFYFGSYGHVLLLFATKRTCQALNIIFGGGPITSITEKASGVEKWLLVVR
jgi:hypothetical protein